HTSKLAEAHNRLKVPVEKQVEAIAARFPRDKSLHKRLKTLWAEETSAVPAASMGLPDISWADIASTLPEVISEVRVIVDNYTSKDRLYYRKDEPATVIFIGGNTLSRG